MLAVHADAQILRDEILDDRWAVLDSLVFVAGLIMRIEFNEPKRAETIKPESRTWPWRRTCSSAGILTVDGKAWLQGSPPPNPP